MPAYFTLKRVAYRVVSLFTAHDGTEHFTYYGPYSSKTVAKGVKSKLYANKNMQQYIESAPVGEWTREED
jgi:hypothetical protein